MAKERERMRGGGTAAVGKARTVSAENESRYKEKGKYKEVQGEEATREAYVPSLEGDDADDADDGDAPSSDDDDSDSSSDSDSDSSHDNDGRFSARCCSSSVAMDSEELRRAVELASAAVSEAFGWKKVSCGGGPNSVDSESRRRGRPSLLLHESAVGRVGRVVDGPKVASAGSGEREARDKKEEAAAPGNALTQLIPGYTAPMVLEPLSSLSEEERSMKGKGAASKLDDMRRRAERLDASLLRPSRGGKSVDPAFAVLGRVGDVASSSCCLPPSAYKTGLVRHRKDRTAGAGWFGFAPSALTDDLKTDLSLLRSRSYLDPKRFYKKSDPVDAAMVQAGTVIEGAAEYYSARLAKKERRANFAEEMMADTNVSAYAKNHYSKMQRANTEKRKQWGRGGKARKTRAERGTSKKRRMGY